MQLWTHGLQSVLGLFGLALILLHLLHLLLDLRTLLLFLAELFLLLNVSPSKTVYVQLPPCGRPEFEQSRIFVLAVEGQVVVGPLSV